MGARGIALKTISLIVFAKIAIAQIPANAEEPKSSSPLLTIPKITRPIAIDGRLSDGEWGLAAKVPYTLLLRTWRMPTQDTQIYVCYSEHMLYIAFDCHEEKMPRVVGKLEERDSDIFRADCVEVFAQPERETQSYYHFAVGISGTMYDAKKPKPTQTDSSWNADWKAAVSLRRDGWSAEIGIPFSVFGSAPEPGTCWKVNFSRESRSSGEFSSWSPVKAGFHEPENFGMLVFGTDVPVINIKQFLASPNGVVERSGEVANTTNKSLQVRMETYLMEALPKTIREITLSIEPHSSQKFHLVDEFREEGRLTAVLEASVGGKPFYRILQPYDVPLIRTRLAEISARLRTLELYLRGMPKDMADSLAASFEALKARRDAVSKSVQYIPEATSGQLAGLSKSLDELERCLSIAEFHAKIKKLKIAVEPGREFAIWPTDPWTQLKPYDIPKDIQPSPEVRAIAYRGEKVYMAFNITNLSDSTLDFRIVIDQSTGNIPANHMQIRTCVFVKEDAEAETLVGDALPLIDEAGRLTIPSEQTSQVFLVVKTDGLEAGDYTGFLSVKPLTGGPEQKVKVSFTIYPLDLPREPKPWICTWGDILKISWAQANPQAYLRDAVEHGVNVFLISPNLVMPTFDKEGNLAKPIDYTRHDELVAAYKPYGMIAGIYSIGLFYDNVAKKAGFEYMGPEYRRGFINWFRDWVGHLKSLGLDYNDFAFELVDEPASQAKLKIHADIGRLVREADPKARILVTANFTEVERLKQIKDAVDIWVPRGPVIEDEDARNFMRNTGKEIWLYVCSGDSKRLDPVGYYRSLAWQSFRHGLTGWGYFAHMWWGEIPWESANTKNERLATFSTVYPGLHGPVPSRRWEAFWKGHEDFRALHLLGRLVSEAEKSGKDTSSAKLVLEEARNAFSKLQSIAEKHVSTATLSKYLDDLRRKVAEVSLNLARK